MNTTRLNEIFCNDFPGIEPFIEEVVKPVLVGPGDEFTPHHHKELLDNDKLRSQAAAANVVSIRLIAEVDRTNSDPFYIYDVTLAPGSHIGHSRVGIQRIIRSQLFPYTHAFIVFHYQEANNRPWRFSYVYKEDTVARMDSAKRFTYVFGSDYRSRTALERFQALALSPRSDEDFAQAFSVEQLSDEFFTRYKQLYVEFVKHITGRVYEKRNSSWQYVRYAEPNPLFESSFGGDDKLVRDYVKKMFGRIVFLYFLQRKGWLGGKRDYMHDLFYESDQKDDFLDQVLEPLFFELLNTHPDNRPKQTKDLPDSEAIPYLNGGLFERDDVDARQCRFPQELFQQLFDLFDSYNFTIDENDPDDAEVGIDPEMLGRIFENLLEDNKDKGAYYTPKEIVEYMCRESIITYLQNGLPERSHQLIRDFVETLDGEKLNDEQATYLRRKLQAVKICDPAIGSGAFPMGMVNLLSKLYIAMRADTDRTRMKRHIMENSIYGVDLERGAVDIARLRFWLAMVVDAAEPEPLPNLNYRIMQGNSLLEFWQGLDLSKLMPGPHDGRLPLNLEPVEGEQYALDVFHLDSESELLSKFLKDYYDTSDHVLRKELKEKISCLVMNQIRETGIDPDTLTGLDPSANSEFFLWHTWFADIFTQGGFDIVIGNPPYRQLQNNGGELAEKYQNSGFQTFARTGDIYTLFYEKGMEVLRPGGHLCFITSNKWMRAAYGEKTRRFFAAQNPVELIDFASVKVFENATVDTNILMLQRANNAGKTRCAVLNKKDGFTNMSLLVRQSATTYSFSGSESWVILSPIEQSIRRKIEAVGTPLRDWDINIYRGVLTGCNEAFIITTEKREQILAACADADERKRTEELIRPILRGRDIKRYAYEWAGLYLIATFPARHYDIEDYPAVRDYLLSFGRERLEQTGKTYIVNGEKIKSRKKTNNKWFEVQDSISYWEDFKRPKIVWGEISDKSKFAFDFNGDYIPEATTFLMTGEHIEYLLAALNSKVSEWLFSKTGTTTGVGTVRWKKYTIEQLLVARPDKARMKDYLAAFEKFKDNELSVRDFEEYCDTFMNHLYGLTTDEIRYFEDNE